MQRLAGPYGYVRTTDDSILFPVAHSTPMLPLVFIQPNCPITPLGAVNTENRFNFLDPAACRAIASSNPENLRMRARFGGSDRPGWRTEKGVEFTIEIDIYCVDSGKSLMTQHVSILKFVGSKGPRTPRAKVAVAAAGNPLVTADSQDSTGLIPLSLDSKAPRDWAACTLDYNPIHISYLASRYLFGFPGVIAHGNLVLAVLIETVEAKKRSSTSCSSSEIDLFHEKICLSSSPVAVLVRFRRPVIVPTRLEAQISGSITQTQTFQIMAGRKVCIEGEIWTV
ncbi:hypothetical protein VTO42DRAFT_1436 [Malbranchea cinnamomea]